MYEPGEHHLADAGFGHLSEIRQQIELQTFGRTGGEDRIDCQQHHDGQQAEHHDFRDPFHAVLQTSSDDREADDSGQKHPEHLFLRCGKQRGESGPDSLGVKT